MEPQEYARLREHERSYWWHVGKRAHLSALLRWGVPPDPDRPGLDVGCGAGGNFPILAPYGRFFGSEVERDAWPEDGADLPQRPVVLARGERLPFADASLGLCTFFDVLEHVEDERGFLAEVYRVLRPGGLVLVSVPAYMFLWSGHDVSLHHFRRYERRTLVGALAGAGFQVLRATYAFAVTFPAVCAVRLLGRLLPGGRAPRTSYVLPPAPLNSLLARVIELEARWVGWSDLPFGSSVMALARRGSA
jgi:SAM-dependent methyltransferase